jgi:sugar phosphate permease
MNHEHLRGFLQIGFFVGGGGFLLALAHPADTPEFVASVCSGIIGLTLVLGVVGVSWWLRDE